MLFGHESTNTSLILKSIAVFLLLNFNTICVSYGQPQVDPVQMPVQVLPVDPPRGILDTAPSRMQAALPAELVIPPPSEAAKHRASRFVEAEINPELPLSLLIGRPKILRLADTPIRIYVPNDDTVRAELIDQQSGRELAVTGLRAGNTTLMLWFADPTEPRGESVVSYLVRVYDDPVLSRPLNEVEHELNQKFPNSFVELSDVNGRLMVSGEARDAFEMAQILQVLISARGVTRACVELPPCRPRVASLILTILRPSKRKRKRPKAGHSSILSHSPKQESSI